MERCAMCKSDAEVRCEWGPNAYQRALVCLKHASDLWEAMESRVNAGALYWVNEPLEHAGGERWNNSDH